MSVTLAQYIDHPLCLYVFCLCESLHSCCDCRPFSLQDIVATCWTDSLLLLPHQTMSSNWRTVKCNIIRSNPRVGPGHPSFPPCPFTSSSFPLYFSLSFIGFTYFLLLSIPSFSTRIVPLRFQAGGRRKRPNLGLVCCVCVICIP